MRYYFLKFIDYFLCIDQIYPVYQKIPNSSKGSQAWAASREN